MQTQGVFCYRWTFPQLPWGTVKNPTFIQTKHGYRTYYFQCFWSKNSTLLATDFLPAAGGNSLVNPYVPQTILLRG